MGLQLLSRKDMRLNMVSRKGIRVRDILWCLVVTLTLAPLTLPHWGAGRIGEDEGALFLESPPDPLICIFQQFWKNAYIPDR